jgi:hypothetical protein
LHDNHPVTPFSRDHKQSPLHFFRLFRTYLSGVLSSHDATSDQSHQALPNPISLKTNLSQDKLSYSDSIFRARCRTADRHFKRRHIMRVAENFRLHDSKLKVKYHDTLIKLSGAIILIAFLFAIYAASMSPGTTADEFASMSAFP